MRQKITDDLITESLIPTEKMLAAIIRHFGVGATAVEMTVYAYMRHLCPAYDGGMWNYYELSNGGFYMIPEGEKLYNLVSPNSYEDTMTSKEAGITACLFAFSFVAGKYQSQRLCYHYEWLWEYISYCCSNSAQKIFAAID